MQGLIERGLRHLYGLRALHVQVPFQVGLHYATSGPGYFTEQIGSPFQDDQGRKFAEVTLVQRAKSRPAIPAPIRNKATNKPA